MYAQVVFPAAFRNAFTYNIPVTLSEEVSVGKRVVVPFGRRYRTGFVISLGSSTDVENVKDIKDVLDSYPVFDEDALKFYEWLAEYYISSLGEALKNIVPYGTDIETKKKIVSDPEVVNELLSSDKNNKTLRFKILRILEENPVVQFTRLQKLVGKKNIYSAVNSLESEGIISVLNELGGARVGVKTEKYVELNLPETEIFELLPDLEGKNDKQVHVLLELISKQEKGEAVAVLKKKLGLSDSPINTLAKKGVLKLSEKEVQRTPTEEFAEEHKDVNLTTDQQQVVDEVSNSIKDESFKTYLLQGVTGSGKTQVYIELTKKVLKRGKNVIILVPEIALTPQITGRFINAFGEKVAVMHSRLSLGERYDTWRNIVKGKYSVVIGARSALFSPLKNVGLIVVDEEHDSSYKQYEIVPKYNARDAAIMKGNLESFPVLLGSATPSVESRYNADFGKYKLLRLDKRIDNAKLPEIKLIDVTLEQRKKRMENIFSRDFLDAVHDRLKKDEGVIILQNRRGFATQIYCEDCGEIEMCPNCSVALVHHLHKNILQCHYCGVIKKVPKGCSNCGSIALKFFGTGTQRVEDELDYYFPDIAMERVDSDAINKKGKLGKIFNSFRNGETKILVGTQMVSKGLDFSHVTLVGVVSAETSLWMPDFRADERTFQLLTQVSGRAGRSEKPGLVLIQTRDKNHFVLQQVLKSDYEGFYEREINLRKQSGYPPFTRLCVIEAKDEKLENAAGALKSIYDTLEKIGKGLQIAPPNPAPIERIKGFYRYQIVIKSFRNIDPSGRLLREAVLESYINFRDKSRFRDVRVSIDVDPQSVL